MARGWRAEPSPASATIPLIATNVDHCTEFSSKTMPSVSVSLVVVDSFGLHPQRGKTIKYKIKYNRRTVCNGEQHVEEHAFSTYDKFLSENEEMLKQQPAPKVRPSRESDRGIALPCPFRLGSSLIVFVEEVFAAAVLPALDYPSLLI